MTISTTKEGVEGSLSFSIKRFFSKEGICPFDAVEWEQRDAVIRSPSGKDVFSQRGVSFPKFWSQTATNVVASKYFSGSPGSSDRESSLKQLIDRVASTIASWGRGSYFDTDQDQEVFYHELVHILLHQRAAFNSPVWFNVGIEERPQCSACFINSVEDSMESILELAKTEGMLFKYGSGTGSNLSVLRSSKEPLKGGGVASGPVSFMKGFDAFAGVIKSGGKTRRAAKMVILDASHPDIVDFIECKTREEKKAWSLIEAGYDGSIDGEAYGSVFFQNANHSVRVTDEFMHRVEQDGEWETRAVVSNKVMDSYRARVLLRKVAEATHSCGDPGLQFDTTINEWSTCAVSGRINSSNPCSEYMFLDDTACNLASINLLRYLDHDGNFDVGAFCHTIRVLVTAQEIIVGNASYPTGKIAENSELFRPLGLGYANLGAMLMALGLPYDSEAGRAYAASITAILSGEGYRTSALLASKVGPFSEFERNKKPMLKVIRKHADHVSLVKKDLVPDFLLNAAQKVWDDSVQLGELHGFRNAQISVLAPTGTIAFMMDCDTTGVEPDIALVKYKNLVGGGLIKIVNQTVPRALDRLGYDEEQQRKVLEYIEENDTIEGAPFVDPLHLPVFDCAFKPTNGSRFIHFLGHVRMMAAVQPFISGAISKTVNVPNDISVDEIMNIYLEAWKLGLKAIAIYRDGSKRIQPLEMSKQKREIVVSKSSGAKSNRRRLPDTREAITHKFSISGHEGYITVGMYEDKQPGEIFVVMAKEGSTISGLMDSFATAISLLLQHQVPLEDLVNKFTHVRFEPSGFTQNSNIQIAKSIVDYLFRWLAITFLPKEGEEPYLSQVSSGLGTRSKPLSAYLQSTEKQVFQQQSDAPSCSECGSLMVRSGSCYVCMTCASTSGCS